METNMNRKIEQAKEYLGTHWVLAKNSTYNAKRREQGMCATLRSEEHTSELQSH